MNSFSNLALDLSRHASPLFGKLSRLKFDWMKTVRDLVARANKEAANSVSIIGIDGTTLLGEWTPIACSSHVRTICDRWPVQQYRKMYVHGPETLGLKVPSRISEVLSGMYSMGVGDFVLIGYSRGCHIAIEVAKRIEIENTRRREVFELLTGPGALGLDARDIGPFRPIRVRALGLFDAVDRELFNNTQQIPRIVENTYHAIRSPEVGSRSQFGNTGVVQNGNWYESEVFAATHAGMGGLPWMGDHPVRTVPLRLSNGLILGVTKEPTITEEQDRQASSAVFEWMWPRLQLHRVITTDSPLGLQCSALV